jgi:hypothetical protein
LRSSGRRCKRHGARNRTAARNMPRSNSC